MGGNGNVKSHSRTSLLQRSCRLYCYFIAKTFFFVVNYTGARKIVCFFLRSVNNDSFVFCDGKCVIFASKCTTLCLSAGLHLAPVREFTALPRPPAESRKIDATRNSGQSPT